MTTGHGDWPCQDPGCPEWAEWVKPGGPDRVREAIARDRGEYAPQLPVWLCGGPDDRATAHRADWDGWTGRGPFRPLAGRWNHWMMRWRIWRRRAR